MGVTKQAEAFLDLPQGALTNELLMEVRGRRQVIVEGACDMLAYDDGCVRLRTADGELRLCGDRLTIDAFGASGTAVTGRLLSIEFL